MKFIHDELDNEFIKKVTSNYSEIKAKISNVYDDWGFISLGKDKDMANFFEKNRGKWSRFVQIGMGGSTLGAEALNEFLGTPEGKSVQFVNNIDSQMAKTLLSYRPDTLYHIVSKSGATTETISNLIYLINHFKGDLKKQLIISTGNSGFLKEFACRHSIKRFSIPENVGGRYSIFSPVGMALASFMQYDIDKIFQGASETAILSGNTPSFPYLFSMISSELFNEGKTDLVIFCYSKRLMRTAYWFRQLWAESLGKLNKRNGKEIRSGQTPIVAEGAADQHSQLQLYREGPLNKQFCFIEGPIDDDQKLSVSSEFSAFSYLDGYSLDGIKLVEAEATKQSLSMKSPVMTIKTQTYSEKSFGKLIMGLMLATAIAGEILDINAFNQPGVELGKVLTKKLFNK